MRPSKGVQRGRWQAGGKLGGTAKAGRGPGQRPASATRNLGAYRRHGIAAATAAILLGWALTPCAR